jgi:hypothetical protein
MAPGAFLAPSGPDLKTSLWCGPRISRAGREDADSEIGIPGYFTTLWAILAKLWNLMAATELTQDRPLARGHISTVCTNCRQRIACRYLLWQMHYIIFVFNKLLLSSTGPHYLKYAYILISICFIYVFFRYLLQNLISLFMHFSSDYTHPQTIIHIPWLHRRPAQNSVRKVQNELVLLQQLTEPQQTGQSLSSYNFP